MTSFADAMPRGFGRPMGTGKAKQTGAQGGRSVQQSAELRRVISLPRRDMAVYDAAFAAALSKELRRPGSTFELRVKQAPMLVEAVEAGGMLGGIDVGEGKSVVAPLFGKVLDVAPVVLLVPPQMKVELQQRVLPWLRREIDFVPPIIVSYSELSTAGKDNILERIGPKAIVCDEAHNLRHRTAARTKRFLRYFDAHPETILIALSGTLHRKSLLDLWHIVQLTHKGWRCPLTRQWKEAKDWAAALDPQVRPEERLRPGALNDLCRPGEEPKDGLRRRLADTDGVILGGSEGVGASLRYVVSAPPLPSTIDKALKTLRKDWTLPGGGDVVDALDFHRRARELAQGFYYVWDWGGRKPDDRWLEARAEWRSAVAAITKLNRPGLDSELLVRNAVRRDDRLLLPKGKLTEALLLAWKAWQPVMGKAEPETKPVWLDDFFAQRLFTWGLERRDEDGCLIWIDSRAMMERVQDLLGGRHDRMFAFGPGERASQALVDLAMKEPGPDVVFLSASSHGTGKNLQRWSRMLVPLPWPSGADWTQRIARAHRPGQLADEVVVDVWAHTQELREALKGAKEQSEKEITGAAQKMLQGTWEGWPA